MKMSKKGVSPIVATALLIILVVILSMILWLWIRSFIGEKVTKNLGGGDEAIENFCEKLLGKFSADVYIDDILKADVENQGDVPLYGIEIKRRGLASLKSLGTAIPESGAITSGETARSIIVVQESGVTPNVGDRVIVLPMLLGESGGVKKSYTCDKEFGFETEIK